MRVVILAVLLCVACGQNTAEGQPGSASAALDEAAAREQARFDAARKPEEVVKALGLHPGSRVADIGAGSGLLTVHLARAVKPNGKVVATDIDEDVLKLMRARLAAAGLGAYVEQRVVGPDEPGLGDGGFDAILLAEVDHYFNDPVAWLETAAKALAPGGRIVISNRIHHRTQSMASAQKAGLKLLEESAPVPTHFIAVFVVGGGA